MKKNILLVLLAVMLPTMLSAQHIIQRPQKKQPTTTKKQQPVKRTLTEEERLVLQRLVDNMVYVEGGTFTMGATQEQVREAYFNESPAHQVTLSSFSIGKYEVTQAEWEAVMGTTVARQRDKANKEWPLCGVGPNYPMYYLSWYDCQEFIRRLNALTGKNFRLPTEAEWEYAARGGNSSNGYKYAGSNTPDDVAWYKENSDKQAHEVGQKSPNELGLYDMSGNVQEWCQDWFRHDYYAKSPASNPTGLDSGTERMNRGGGFFNRVWSCRVSCRGTYEPDIRFQDFGLRLAL